MAFRVARNDSSCSVESFRKLCVEGQFRKACEALNVLEKRGIRLLPNIFYCLLQECINNKDLKAGREVHSLIRKSRLESNSFLGSYLIRMFALCGSLSEANLVFDKLPEPNVFSWSAIILGYVKHGQAEHAVKLYHQMRQSGVMPDEHVFVAALKACTSLACVTGGKQIHDHVIGRGLELNLCVGSTIIDMYAKCGSLVEARKVFDMLQKQSVLPWNVMITGYAQHGHSQQALQLFKRMQQQGLEPNNVTFVNTLKACTTVTGLEHGKLIHNNVIESGFESDIAVGNILIDMYLKCGSLEEACIMFDRLHMRNVVTWNAMIAGYALSYRNKALCLFEKMQLEGFEPNIVTFVNILKACCSESALDDGKAIHVHIVKSGLESEVNVGCSLMDTYAKCGSLKDARRVFDKLQTRDVVTWNAMIAGYANHGHGLEALELFERMVKGRLTIDKVTIASTLKACSSITALDQGHLVYNQILESDFKIDAAVGSTLIVMYAKFGSIKEARRVLDNLEKPDVVAWNVMLAGYVQHEHSQDAFELFQQMQDKGTEPNNVTYVIVLKACYSIVGLDYVKLIHGSIIESGFELDDFVANSFIDKYSKCGSLEDAGKVFEKLPKCSMVAWSTMVAGYALQSDYEMALQYFEGMQEAGFKPDGATFVSLLSACSHRGLVEEGFHHFKSMIEVHGIIPILEHYTCIADLLSRGGHLDEAENLLQSIPCQSNVVGWISLLSNCRTHREVEIAKRCFDRIVAIDCGFASAYVLMSNIYADAGMWEEADKIEQLREFAWVCKRPGKAIIEVNSNMYEFIVGDQSHPRSHEIYRKLSLLALDIQKRGHVPNLDSVLQAMTVEDEEDPLCGHCEKFAISFGLNCHT